MDKKLIDWVWRSGPSYQANVSAWLAQGIADGGTPPSSTVLNALSVWMNYLDSVGLGPSGSRLKTLNILHAGSKEFAKLNLKNPATYKYVESGTVTFSEGNGCRSASSSYFSQPFKSDEYPTLHTDLTMGCYVSESSTAFASVAPFGFKTNSGGTYRILRTLINGTQGDRFTNSTSNVFANTNHKGSYIQTYNSATARIYKDGVVTQNSPTVVASNISIDRLILAYNDANAGITAAGHFPRYVAIDFMADSFSNTDAANWETGLNAYKTAVSLP